MTQVSLDADGPAVSRMALGTWPFAGDVIWGPSEEARCVAVIHAAIERGINLFDTAPNYGDGRSESILGRALKGRNDVLVATKFKIDNQSKSGLRRAVHASLRRLQRDRIDLMQIHWPGRSTGETQDALDLLESLQKEGLVRFLGVCNFGRYDLEEHPKAPIVSNQIPYSLMWRVAEREIAQASRERGLTTIAYSPLQQGLLTGRYLSLAEFPEGRKRTRHFHSSWPGTRHESGGMETETETVLHRLLEISEESGRSMLDLALAFVHSRPFIDMALVGARTVKQLHASCNGAECELTPDELAALEAASAPLLHAAGGNLDMYLAESRVRFTGQDGLPTHRV